MHPNHLQITTDRKSETSRLRSDTKRAQINKKQTRQQSQCVHTLIPFSVEAAWSNMHPKKKQITRIIKSKKPKEAHREIHKSKKNVPKSRSKSRTELRSHQTWWDGGLIGRHEHEQLVSVELWEQTQENQERNTDALVLNSDSTATHTGNTEHLFHLAQIASTTPPSSGRL